MKNERTVDLILPFYKPKGDWDKRVAESVSFLKDHFEKKDIGLTLYLVNDGSDLSHFPEEKLDRIREAAGNFQFLSYPENRGKGYCLRYAVSKAHGTWQIYTDGDFPFSPRSAADACEVLLSGADVVMGIRSSDYKKALSPLRKLLSSGARKLNRFLLNLPDEYLDTQAGLKGFGEKGREMFLKTKVDTFVFDTEFILLSWKNHLNIKTIPLTLRPGLTFSRMGMKIMLRELLHFIGILFRIRFSRTNKETCCGKSDKISEI